MTSGKVSSEQLRQLTDDSLFNFKTSTELTPASACAGQDRAISVLRSALSIPGLGYHVIALGKEGTARLECIYSVVKELESTRSDNVDRVLLPVSGRHMAFEEIQLQPGGARLLIMACRNLVEATINGKSERREFELKTLLEKFADHHLLSGYLQSLDDATSSVLVDTRSEVDIDNAEIRELQGMIPVLLYSGRQQDRVCLMDSFPDPSSLLGTVSVDPESGCVVINEGTLIQASAGFLIVDGRRLLANKAHWQLLREILKTGMIPLCEIPPAQTGQGGTNINLNGAIRLTCRMILLCDSAVMDALHDTDHEIENVFSDVAEFESEMERNDETCIISARLIASLIQKYKCLPLDPPAMAAMIDASARFTDCQHRLTLNRAGLSKYLREASLQAKQAGDEIITRQQIKSVIAQNRDRVMTDRRDALQAIIYGETQVKLTGKAVGQINGLTIVGTGMQSYLEPSRITATVRAGEGTVVDIEREVNLGGSIHSKGVMILTSLLAARYSRHVPLSLVATLVFEQSYSEVDGDSASAAEMVAILSAVTEIPIRQELAITGSIDQRGQILCVGDINSKIEGYYRLIQLHGNVPGAGVVIPASNMRDLMLDDDVVQAVADGRFTIYAVATLDDLIELFSGMPAGAEDDSHEFPAGSFNAQVHASLKQFSEEKKEEHKETSA
ncbi:MAG: AAA family ATPase [Arenicellales bacterium]